MTTVNRPETISLRAIGKRLVLMIVVVVVSTVVLIVAGVPEAIARTVAMGAAMTIAFAGVYPPETPHRWRKNAIAWGALFVLFAGAWLLVSRWRGV